MSRTLCLAGMMGAGKSTVGALVAERLGRRFVDADAEIERWTGERVADLFATRGEDAFRVLEHRVVTELVAVPDLVVALGGGAVLRADTVESLRLGAATVLLDVPTSILAARVARTEARRPVLAERTVAAGDDTAAALTRLWDERRERYLAAADAVIDGSATPEVVAAAVLAWAVGAGDVLTPSEHEAVAS